MLPVPATGEAMFPVGDDDTWWGVGSLRFEGAVVAFVGDVAYVGGCCCGGACRASEIPPGTSLGEGGAPVMWYGGR